MIQDVGILCGFRQSVVIQDVGILLKAEGRPDHFMTSIKVGLYKASGK